MIITHSNKFLTPKSKVVGCLFNSSLDVPDFLISSNCVTQSRKFWANPSSAAYYKEAKEMAEKANMDGVDGSDFPNFVDGYTKQLFLRTNVGYIVHSPLTSCALIDEFSTKARAFNKVLLDKYLEYKEYLEYMKNKDPKAHSEMKPAKFFGAGYFSHRIQPRGVTLGNRGELAVAHGGEFLIKTNPFLGCFRRNKEIMIDLDENKKYLYFYGTLNDANFNSGFISSGLPALTAIGGMIESVELKLNYDEAIPFAFGLKNCQESKGGKLGLSLKKGAFTPHLALEEKKGSLDFVIVLDVTNFNSDDIIAELMRVKRLAGGVIFDYHFSNEAIDEDSNYFFIRSFKSRMQKAIDSKDVINYIITHRLHPIACGYAILQQPNFKDGVRVDKANNQYLHAFSETLFIPIRLSKRLDSKSFFKRKIYKNCTVYV
ncbi:hypothetical protein [Gilliamella sp. BG7]|uniref:hypothetical protein n=1 Tax=unclassified Gilliamella TaxID=2685620 RepID=UPI00398728A3